MKCITILLALCAGMLLAGVTTTPATAAETYRSVDTASAQDIIDGMAAKGVRGAANLVTGWAEIPKQIYVTGEEGGWLRGAVIGPFKGIGMALVRTVSGAGELVTFFVAYPGYYDSWIEPRFVWQSE
jgi:putative exosortase-associated protein (TIGR04073 family)